VGRADLYVVLACLFSPHTERGRANVWHAGPR